MKWDGQEFFVASCFDVSFDIRVTDVDDGAGRDYAGQPDSASFTLIGNGPAFMQSQSRLTVTFDKNTLNFGLLPPPQSDPYIGHFKIEIPLGGTINGNGEDDKTKFTLASHTAGDRDHTFVVLPDGTVLDEFDSAAFVEGAVVDVTTDPPFTLVPAPGNRRTRRANGTGNGLEQSTQSDRPRTIHDRAVGHGTYVAVQIGNRQDAVNAVVRLGGPRQERWPTKI